MTDYEPLDISGLCTDKADDETSGDLLMRGLPFAISEGPRVIVPTEPVRIPVGKAARRVIFAHRQLGSHLSGGFGVGAHVADYVFRLQGSDPISVPIRERFEIQVVPTPWGHEPYLAVSDRADTLMPRWEGRFEIAGFRQCEFVPGFPRSYYLWAWSSPDPGRVIESVELVPRKGRFLVAAVTLGHADEHPFVREAKRDVRLLIDEHHEEGRLQDLEVHPDRGIATYVQPLAADGSGHPGWGEEDSSGSAYAEVAATPSARLRVERADGELASVAWAEVVDKGAAESGPVRVELIDHGRNWVHVTVLDDQTGKPTPCRVRFRSKEGIPYQPHGHHHHVNSHMGTWHIDVGGDVRLGGATYAYIDGRCQGWLPRGEVVVEAARGFEYEPLRETLTIAPGQRELTIRLARWTDQAAAGWHSGDSHVYFLSTQGAHLEQQGEDLRVVNLLQSQWGALFTNTEDFTGRVSTTPDGQYLTYVGQENRQHFMGHLILWGLRDPVMPWCSDGPHEAELGGNLETTMSRWADHCHAQGGTVVIPHFPNPNGEPAVLVATGRADAVETLVYSSEVLEEYYRYLNCGYRLPFVGGTDKMSSHVPVGLNRTYAYIPPEEAFGYEAWCRAVRAGRTFVSSGPIVGITVEGSSIGDTLDLPGPGTIEVEAWADSIFPLASLEIVQGGQVVASAEAKGSRRLAVKERLSVDSHTWVAARTKGLDDHLDEWQRAVFAHTSPIYVACGGPWSMYDHAVARYLLTLVEGGLAYISETALRYPAGSVTHHHSEGDHLAFLKAPFLQARNALHDRARGT